MLLFVVESELDQLEETRTICCDVFDERHHRFIDPPPVFGHLVVRRTSDETSVGASMPGADRLVIGIELYFVTFVVPIVPRLMGHEEEGLEEPGDMRSMPFGRTDVRHRLDLLILRGQGGREGFGLSTDIEKSLNGRRS